MRDLIRSYLDPDLALAGADRRDGVAGRRRWLRFQPVRRLSRRRGEGGADRFVRGITRGEQSVTGGKQGEQARAGVGSWCAQTQSTSANTSTVTQTAAASQPAQATTVTNQNNTSISASKSTNVTATQTAQPTSTGAPGASGGGMPWWGWVLVGLAAATVVAAIFVAGRHRGRREGAAQATPGEQSSTHAGAPSPEASDGSAPAPPPTVRPRPSPEG